MVEMLYLVKVFCFCIASAQARDEGWMAEHMLILKLTNPEGSSLCNWCFPSLVVKPLIMLVPTIPGC